MTFHFGTLSQIDNDSHFNAQTSHQVYGWTVHSVATFISQINNFAMLAVINIKASIFDMDVEDFLLIQSHMKVTISP